jgi:DNA-directed RNA polymerase specialized sigma24 family protein
MARDAAIEARLLRWAEYMKSGDGSGYPVRNVLDENWSPPAPGATPSMRTCPMNDARQTDRLVRKLSERLQATLVAHYIKRMPAALAAVELECMPDTVTARIEAAHRALLGLLQESRTDFCNIG